MLVDAAARNQRCPQNSEINDALCAAGLPTFCAVAGGTTPVILALKNAGKIVIEVWGRNWRVVEICVGEHKGKRTLACPNSTKRTIVLKKHDPLPPG